MRWCLGRSRYKTEIKSERRLQRRDHLIDETICMQFNYSPSYNMYTSLIVDYSWFIISSFRNYRRREYGFPNSASGTMAFFSMDERPDSWRVSQGIAPSTSRDRVWLIPDENLTLSSRAEHCAILYFYPLHRRQIAYRRATNTGNGTLSHTCMPMWFYPALDHRCQRLLYRERARNMKFI